MKVLVIEDDRKKRSTIAGHLKLRGTPADDILYAENVAEFVAQLNSDIDLFILDIRLPSIEGAPASQNGKTLIECIFAAGKSDALLLAISSFPADFEGLRPYFETHGCILADFGNSNGWKATLDHLLTQRKKRLPKTDFLIFCALEEERAPYIALFKDGKVEVRGNIECYDIKIGKKKGSVVLLPKMGLINAAITSSICIDRYRPSLVAMSGVCGGFKARASIGQLLVSEMAYEYQSGKWTTDGFSQEPYQVSMDHSTLTALRPLVGGENLIAELEVGFKGTRPSKQHAPMLGIFTSGSAVIADAKFLEQVSTIHRKVAGLDMEIFAVHRAAELSVHRPACICAKTVVDLCDADKADDIHHYGSHISATFVVRAVDNFFRAREETNFM